VWRAATDSVAGERRLRAAKMAGLSRIPCILVDADDTDSSVLKLVENLHRQDLDFIQEAEALNQLITVHGLSREEVARRIGHTQSAVANNLRVLKLSGEILYLIREAELTERHARALLSSPPRSSGCRCWSRSSSRGSTWQKPMSWLTASSRQGKTPRPLFIIRDVRLFLNTVDKGVTMMRDAGIDGQLRPVGDRKGARPDRDHTEV
jgi:ParB family chromosome partitioning protein